MNRMRNQIVILLLLLVSCKETATTVQSDTFKPVLAALFVDNIDRSIDWYQEKLGFVIESEKQAYPDYGLKIAFLALNGFHLEIIEKTNSFKSTEIVPNESTFIGGVFKIGFRTADLQHVFTQLQRFEDVEVLAGIGDLPESSLPIDWPSQYFLIQDPDGNYLQFFDAGESQEVAPWLIMITVDDLEHAKTWYSEAIGFTHHGTMGEKGNQRAVLERNNYVLELFAPNEVVKANQLSTDTTILGFAKIAFGLKDLSTFSSKLPGKNVEIISPIEDSNFEWADQAMMLKDPEGNWTQLFEIHN